MRHRKKGKILDRKIGPRRALLRGLATQMVLYEKIKTTEAKAKAVRPLVERMVTKAKRGRQSDFIAMQKFFLVPGAIKKIREVIAPRYATRPGGYTRILKLGTRKGDGAHTAQIEFV